LRFLPLGLLFHFPRWYTRSIESFYLCLLCIIRCCTCIILILETSLQRTPYKKEVSLQWKTVTVLYNLYPVHFSIPITETPFWRKNPLIPYDSVIREAFTVSKEYAYYVVLLGCHYVYLIIAPMGCRQYSCIWKMQILNIIDVYSS